MITPRRTLTPLAISLVAAGCGGGGGGDDSGEGTSSASAADRITGCLDKQPEATKGDCEGWDKDKQLADDGTHKGHENMDG